MTTNTHPPTGERTHEHGTNVTRVRALSAAVAAVFVSLLPVLALLAVAALAVANPELAFVLFGLPTAAVVGVAFVFAVGRVGAAITTRI